MRRPRKSIFSRPAFSTSPISHWVLTTSLSLSLFGSLWSGTRSLERAVGDHDAGGVRADVADGPFEPAGEVDQLADLGVLLGQPPQRRALP